MFHDRACHKARITATLPATEYARSSGDAIRFADCAATSADKSVVPPGAFKIGRTRRFVRKQALKLRQRARERQITSLKHIDCHGSSTSIRALNILHPVVVCDNPISTLQIMGARPANFDVSHAVQPRVKTTREYTRVLMLSQTGFIRAVIPAQAGVQTVGNNLRSQSLPGDLG